MRVPTNETGTKQFKLCVTMGGTIADTYDLAEALQRVVDGVERGRLSGVVVDATGQKVGEYSVV